MKPERSSVFLRITSAALPRALALAALLLGAVSGLAQIPPPGNGYWPTNTPLETWSFYNHTYWPSDDGYYPVSFTNLAYSDLGDFSSLVVDTNVPAWLQYYVHESGGTTNLTVDVGSVLFWFGPDWSSTNAGGTGPGESGRLLEVGGYTPNSSFGWWGLYVDSGGNNLYFSAQTNDLSSSITTYLSCPISWTTNYFHFIALTYSSTNTTLYLDGALATNGPPLTVYPGTNVLANGFFIGSDSNGVYQAHGLFNSLATYNYPMDSNTVAQLYSYEYGGYMMNPFNLAMNIVSAPSSPTYTPTFDVITGQGSLQWVGSTSCSYNANVWITNVMASVASNGTMNVTFSIGGGASGVPYDVFANSVLSFGPNGVPWAWMGQGYACNTYTLTNLPSGICFLILGTPQDTSGSGLTDAYELLVAKVSPTGSQADSYGIPYAWYAENGLVPITNGAALQDPDQDALLNFQEYQYGSRPNVSEGFSIWTTVGTTSIP